MALVAVLALTAAASTSYPAVKPDPCTTFEISDKAGKTAPPRPMTALDLATIADIGRADPYDSPSPFGISPDGSMIAFLVRRANPTTNSFCQRLMIAPLTSGAAARERDRGGEFIRPTFRLRNLSAVQAGFAQVITPRWSPDGTRIAYLKRKNGRTDIWSLNPNIGLATQATHSTVDIEDFGWTPDGRAFVVAQRPELAAAQSAIDQEALRGFLFDARFSPMMSDRPFPVGSYPTRYFHVDLQTGVVREATTAETALLNPGPSPQQPVGSAQYAINSLGDQAWTEKKAPDQLFSPRLLRVRWRNGGQALCADDRCANIRRVWWAPSKRDLYFLTREGWKRSQTALYRWSSSKRQPIRVFNTDDTLVGCDLKNAALVCAREGSRTPRQLVMIDLATGKSRTIFDPNPQLKGLKLGAARRLKYRNAYGIECYSDLVLPPDHRPGEKHPLIVVQYFSEGFLRGGTGDEVPIQVLAAKGFAVLSVDRPFDPPGTEGAVDELDYRRRVRRDWIDRRSVESGIEKGVAAAIETGTVDPARLGITGFSEGTSAVQWALINSRLFTVASLGVCCEDKLAMPLNGGIGMQDDMNEMGYPLFKTTDERFWAPYSLLQNADTIHVPILVQTSDDEYEAGLDVLQAFRARGNPIELYVFDNEPHVKWQPAHRLAMYDRVTDWFSFWFMRKIDCDPRKRDQYARWKAMRGAPGSFTDNCSADLHAAP